MKWTQGRLFDKETIEYFIPRVLRGVRISESDWKLFFENSEQGLVTCQSCENKYSEKRNACCPSCGNVKTKVTPGLEAVLGGKSWRGIHMHEMYEPGVLDGSMPYCELLRSMEYRYRRPRWLFKILNHFWGVNIFSTWLSITPRPIVEFMKKEMFQGIDADLIETVYQLILESKL